MILEEKIRAKLYLLDNDDNWADQGTGMLSCEFNDLEKPMWVLILEDTQEKILESPIMNINEYQRQQESLIIWSWDNNDYALSFEAVDGCTKVWYPQTIFINIDPSTSPSSSSSNTPTPPLSNSPQQSRMSSTGSNTAASTNALYDALISSLILHPDCEIKLEDLDDILDKLKSILKSVYSRDKFALKLINSNFFHVLLKLSDDCIDLDAFDEIKKLSHILRLIIMLNNCSILELLVKNDNIYTVVKLLGYNEEEHNIDLSHYNYLIENNLKQVVPIYNQEIVEKIKVTIRTSYLKDYIFNTFENRTTLFNLCIPEETIHNNLGMMVLNNNIELVNYFVDQGKFWFDLLALFNPEVHDESDVAKFPKPESQKAKIDREDSQLEGLRFILQLCQIVKGLPPASKGNVYRKLFSYGFLIIFSFCFAQKPNKMDFSHFKKEVKTFNEKRDEIWKRMTSKVKMGMDILNYIIDVDKFLVKTYLLDGLEISSKSPASASSKCDRDPLLELLIDNFNYYPPLAFKAKKELATTCYWGMGIDQYKEWSLLPYTILYLISNIIDCVPYTQVNIAVSWINDTIAGARNRNEPETERLLTIFYDQLASRLFEQLTNFHDISNNHSSFHRAHATELLVLLSELLLVMVKEHRFRCKYFFINCHIFEKLLLLLNSDSKLLQLCTIRVFKAGLTLKEEFFPKQLINTPVIFVRLFALLEQNEKYNNLVYSAILDLFLFILVENCSILISLLSSTFNDALLKLNNIHPMFSHIISKYEQNKKVNTPNITKGENINEEMIQTSTIDNKEKDEDEYFNSDSPDSAPTTDPNVGDDFEEFKPLKIKTDEPEEFVMSKEIKKQKLDLKIKLSTDTSKDSSPEVADKIGDTNMVSNDSA